MLIKKRLAICYKLIITLILILALIELSVNTPAYAASSTWQSRITDFPRVNFNNNAYGTSAAILQKFLYSYNSTTRGYIVIGGGIDGIFGQQTDTALRAFQGAEGLIVDGDCWTSSWAAIATCLNDSLVTSSYGTGFTRWEFYTNSSCMWFCTVMVCHKQDNSYQYTFQPFDEWEQIMGFSLVKYYYD